MKMPSCRFAALVFTVIAVGSSCGQREQDDATSSELDVITDETTSPFTRPEGRKHVDLPRGSYAIAPVDTGTPIEIEVDAGQPIAIEADAGQPQEVDAGVTTALDAGTPVATGDPGPADVRFAIDTSAQVRPISRYIYGKNFTGKTWAQEPNLTMNRLGGNRWSAYNWENNASNAGSDFNYQSDSYLGGGNTPGEAVRMHVADARAAGGATLVTVPILGWVAADKTGTSVLNQPVTSRFVSSVATKGVAFQYPPSLTDSKVSQDEFVSFIESTFPNAHQDPNKEIFYSLDNEPDLWSSTHSAIHPAALTYAELLSKSITFSSAIKAVAPQSKVFGFVSFGYSGYTSLQRAPDGAGRDFTHFFLDGMRDASTAKGTRLLDVLDLHWYPEARGGNVRVIGEDNSAAVATARMQAPRSLWDPSYVETSWITAGNGNQALRLIPSMKEKIAAHYPGTELGFTEYYFGGGAHISGAIAQADVLGIFGREGVHSAALWCMSSNVPYLTAAFAMFRSYDGVGGSFGDLSVAATSTDVTSTSVYASVDSTSPNRVVVVLINKANTPRVAGLTISHGTAFSRAQVYQLTSATPNATRGTDLVFNQPNALSYTMPPLSVSTLVLQP